MNYINQTKRVRQTGNKLQFSQGNNRAFVRTISSSATRTSPSCKDLSENIKSKEDVEPSWMSESGVGKLMSVKCFPLASRVTGWRGRSEVTC